MAENSIIVDATPEQVFAVLLDAWSYKDWVVGADAIRDVDANWPEPGSRFHHTVGAGPAKTDDATRVVLVDPPRRLVLEASAGRAGAATVAFVVEPEGDGSRITIEEHTVDGPADRLPTAVTDLGLRIRNAETLRRLRKVVRDRTSPT